MGKVKLSDPVRHEGEITTISDLDKRGMITFHKSDRFFGGKTIREAYFADIKGTSAGWEIGKLAYLSRTGQKVEV